MTRGKKKRAGGGERCPSTPQRETYCAGWTESAMLLPGRGLPKTACHASSHSARSSVRERPGGAGSRGEVNRGWVLQGGAGPPLPCLRGPGGCEISHLWPPLHGQPPPQPRPGNSGGGLGLVGGGTAAGTRAQSCFFLPPYAGLNFLWWQSWSEVLLWRKGRGVFLVDLVVWTV